MTSRALGGSHHWPVVDVAPGERGGAVDSDIQDREHTTSGPEGAALVDDETNGQGELLGKFVYLVWI